MLLENIRKLCEGAGTTICEVERACNIANGTIGKWAERTPRLDTVKKVADYFGVTVDSLLAEEENERKENKNDT